MQHGRPDYNRRIQDADGIIPADEPVFLLRAQDKAAALTVRFWAFKALEEGADPETVRGALEVVKAMEAWPTKKAPDAPKP